MFSAVSVRHCKPLATRILDERDEEWHGQYIVEAHPKCEGLFRNSVEPELSPMAIAGSGLLKS